MIKRIGIRREDKNIWERRVPLIPEHIKWLQAEHDIETVLQPFEGRAFSHEEYIRVGATISENLSDCAVIFAVKEIPIGFFEYQKTYIFFSHTIKGQTYNMPMLRRILDLRCQLIDYERVVDANGRRLIFFGRHAGLAGMLDTLWALGKRLQWEGMDNPFTKVRQAHQYESLEQAKAEIQQIGEQIRSQGLPTAITPFVCGFAGYGHVSKGAQEIFDLLPAIEVLPNELIALSANKDLSSHSIYKVIFKEEDMVQPISENEEFELQRYYDHPERYQSKFETYLPYLNILINAIYWEPRYPKLVTKQYLREIYKHGSLGKLRVIGDISCDIEGAIECTLKATEPDNPVFVYDPITTKAQDGYAGHGLVVMAVDNLPCEFPREASVEFSQALFPFVPAIVNADYSVPFARLNLPEEIKKALVVYQGKLTPAYGYLEKFL